MVFAKKVKFFFGNTIGGRGCEINLLFWQKVPNLTFFIISDTKSDHFSIKSFTLDCAISENGAFQTSGTLLEAPGTSQKPAGGSRKHILKTFFFFYIYIYIFYRFFSF